MNAYGRDKVPFLFILDFELQQPRVFRLDEIPDQIYFKFNQLKNYSLSGLKTKKLEFQSRPIDYQTYNAAFDRVKKEILFGNSFLLNLTFATEISTNYSLKALFDIAHAKYKLYYQDEFIVFSPETFVQIKGNKIYTFPMKGTIDADIPDAHHIIMNDLKETAEHYTIVDLLRNDLSMVAREVKVNRFRYADTLVTTSGKLLQVSSEIEGTLAKDYNAHLGDLFNALLPAGSISGAPKKKTIEIITSVEPERRGYYTGVFGIFDGENVDSAVMIRFIEKTGQTLRYRSGCGITNMSQCMDEYHEMINKVYVPVSRKY